MDKLSYVIILFSAHTETKWNRASTLSEIIVCRHPQYFLSFCLFASRKGKMY